MSNKNMKKIKLIFSVLFLIFMIGLTSFFVYDTYYKPSSSPVINNNSNNNTNTNTNDDTGDVSNYVNNLPYFREVYNNPEIYANLIIPSLDMNIMVTRTGDNDFYLNHDVFRNSNPLGNPFIDFRDTDLVNIKQINIYGHNTENVRYYDQLPFTKLQNYTNKDFFDNNKDVILDIDEEEKKYQVIAVKVVTESDSEHMSILFYQEEDYGKHLIKMLNNTMYYDNTSVDKNSNILVLQACNYNPRNSYLLIICKQA